MSTPTTPGRPTPMRRLAAAGDPTFTAMSPPRQVWEAVGGALLTGALAGVALGIHVLLYVTVIVVSVVGGLPAGAQHRTLTGALARAVVGGAAWGGALVAVVAVTGLTPTVPLPDPAIAFLPWAVVPSCLVAVATWSLARAYRRRTGTA